MQRPSDKIQVDFIVTFAKCCSFVWRLHVDASLRGTSSRPKTNRNSYRVFLRKRDSSLVQRIHITAIRYLLYFSFWIQ